MTLDQLKIFIAVAEREHLTRAATALNLTPSAVSAAVQTLEQRYDVRLFHRVGRRIELSTEGRAFLDQARSVVAGAKAAEQALVEFSGVSRGTLTLAASQTLASYWLPPILMRFAKAYPAIRLRVEEGNTSMVAQAVLDGRCELGFIEGEIDEPALATTSVADDRLVVVAAPGHPLLAARKVDVARLAGARYAMREVGSGTRSVFEQAMRDAGLPARSLDIAIELPTNEAVCAATGISDCLTVVSELVARRYVDAGLLRQVAYTLPMRRFAMLRHQERYASKAVGALTALILEGIPSEDRPDNR